MVRLPLRDAVPEFAATV
jgi:hypothetical protein